MREFNSENGLKSEGCALRARDRFNEDVNNYALFNPFITSATDKCKTAIEKLQEFSTENYLQIRDGVGVTNACHVDTDNALRTFNLTNNREIMQLDTRLFKGSPFVGKGSLTNTDAESAIMQGNNTYNSEECSGVSVIDNVFQPLLPCLEETIQNPVHIIPPWIRGGESTRDTLKQSEFLEKTGYQFDGTVWTKKICDSSS